MYMMYLTGKDTYRIPRPVNEMALIFYMYGMFVLHRKHTYGLPPVNEMALLSYM
jgi:hypothetical protein